MYLLKDMVYRSSIMCTSLNAIQSFNSSDTYFPTLTFADSLASWASLPHHFLDQHLPSPTCASSLTFPFLREPLITLSWSTPETIQYIPPCPVSAIKLPHVNYTQTLTCALMPLMPRWKKAMICPPIGFTISGKTFATWAPTTWRYHTYQTTLTWPIGK
jgi:hypothetical protein